MEDIHESDHIDGKPVADHFLAIFEQSGKQLTKAENIALKKGLIDIENGQTIRIRNIHNIWESIV